MMSRVKEHNYLGVMVNDGTQEAEINVRIDKGGAAICKLNSVLGDRSVNPGINTHIYEDIVKSRTTYTADTRQKLSGIKDGAHGIEKLLLKTQVS